MQWVSTGGPSLPDHLHASPFLPQNWMRGHALFPPCTLHDTFGCSLMCPSSNKIRHFVIQIGHKAARLYSLVYGRFNNGKVIMHAVPVTFSSFFHYNMHDLTLHILPDFIIRISPANSSSAHKLPQLMKLTTLCWNRYA